MRMGEIKGSSLGSTTKGRRIISLLERIAAGDQPSGKWAEPVVPENANYEEHVKWCLEADVRQTAHNSVLTTETKNVIALRTTKT